MTTKTNPRTGHSYECRCDDCLSDLALRVNAAHQRVAAQSVAERPEQQRQQRALRTTAQHIEDNTAPPPPDLVARVRAARATTRDQERRIVIPRPAPPSDIEYIAALTSMQTDGNTAPPPPDLVARVRARSVRS